VGGGGENCSASGRTLEKVHFNAVRNSYLFDFSRQQDMLALLHLSLLYYTC